MIILHHKTFFFFIFILSLLTSLSLQPTNASLFKIQLSFPPPIHRRILHQPLFPASSAPPPATESLPPPPPPPVPVFPDPNQPFFPEVPAGQTPDQAQTPPAPAIGGTTTAAAVPNPIATQPTKPTKKVAIAISVGIVTLGMLSGLAFFLYKHKAKPPNETQKQLVGPNSQPPNEESRIQPSTYLYIGTVEPSTTQRSVPESTEPNRSPYRKLSSVKRSDRYRASPDLEPLPKLSKPPPPPAMNSPPAMSSSDEDSPFYTPQCSSVSNEEGFYTPSTKQNRTNTSTTSTSLVLSRNGNFGTSPVPHSKRTSPKSRLSVSSSPDTKIVAVPSAKPPPAPAPPPPPPPPHSTHYSQPAIGYAPRKAKFSSPPPRPDMARIHTLTNNQSQQKSKIPVPPPPPPPPPPLAPLSVPRNLEPNIASSVASPHLTKIRLDSSVTRNVVKTKSVQSVEEVDNGASSSERIDGDDVDGLKPKLKPLHWDKVRATSDRATVWDQLKSSSFQLNEDMMESLFGCNSAGSVPKEVTRKSVLPSAGEQENRVLDPKKSQNIAILLRALNVTRDEVSESLLDGNPEGLGAELLETLVKMAPTKEEEIKLRDYTGEISKLGSAERFLKSILDIPFAFKRVEAMLYRANFNTEVKYLRNSFQTLEAASEELKNSRLFIKLLEAVLRTGNRMNIGTNRGDAKAFKLDTLLKLVDIKGTDGKTTLLHFVVQEIIRSEGSNLNPTNPRTNGDDFKKQGLQVVEGLSRELSGIKKAAGMDSDVLNSYLTKLELGLDKVGLVLQYERPNMQGRFFESMKVFLKEAEEEIFRVKGDQRKALSYVKEVTEYFHGDTAKEGAHPFRIFMIVRDFLLVLDNVCKEVGRMQDKTMVGSARSFRIPATASLPVLHRYNVRQDTSSDDESLSP